MPAPPAPADVQPLRCPACGVPLRLRETRMTGVSFDCPECRERLVLLRDAAGQVELQPATVLQPVAKPERAARGRWECPVPSPLLVAWGLAGMFAAVLIGAVLRDRAQATRTGAAPPLQPAVVAEPANAAPASEPPTVTEPAAKPDSPVSAEPVAAAEAPPTPAPQAEAAPALAQPAVSAADVVATAATVLPVARPAAAKLLQQRILSFQQVKPAPRRDLLQTVEDLLDRPVRMNDDVPAALAARLDEPLTLALENITVEDLLRAILRGTGLQFECTADAVQLSPEPPK